MAEAVVSIGMRSSRPQQYSHRLAAANQALDAKGLAAQFKRTKTTDKKVADVLDSLARLGYVSSADGKTFALLRVA
ncbi:hypothetical protein [Bradyrhizobium sp. 76]|uniref:hypothetical protein n=1 Tax=Bradyrhizobium sp. 76 TaxID=2782680 RepID=UPI001FF909CA|nr:hypothetical protein [Bradyrhizobium sp. 76]MCK1409534.1 hypothetical protein [Bradyrhizobium sp. 76]